MTTGTIGAPFTEDFLSRLERLRAAGALRYDLAQAEPACCGLGRDGADDDVRRDVRGSSAFPRGEALADAREAVASYLAGYRISVRPAHVFFVASASEARRLALAAVAGGEDEVLVPAPARAFVETMAGTPGLRPYRLEFREEWHLDRRSIRRALGPRTRAIVVGNPSEPTGAMLTVEDLAALEDLCAVRGLALVGDEALLDTAVSGGVSVARAERALALHISGLSGVCGLPGTAAEWIALTGPDVLTTPMAARLEALTAAASDAAVRAVPAQLARREPYLAALRSRLARNRGAIAYAALREAPWSLQWGSGGAWAVLQINPTHDDRELCLALLDEGVAVRPGSLDGLPPSGNLVVSLLTEPTVLLGGLDRLERRLRAGD